ncbi:hypothetical protein DBR43_29895 [Pedobacter sp. KBW06]|uniref:FecR family protein n=1 Tax=Pedobacter sp. KBW06 TaxID=2153359 RepID=UPI000F598379|nr:FecR domain-containing protein [Pedobacter sp. KBW06]RQO66427.1 hypothetical protein DBR43_29895 [Pedobacter sp. KBW06]
METNQRISTLFTKYLDNNCSREEFDEFIHLIKTTGNLESMDEAMRLNWDYAKEQPLPYTLSWNEVKPAALPQRKLTSQTTVWLKYAAVLCVLLFAGLVGQQVLDKDSMYHRFGQASLHVASGKTGVVVLEDGTKVTLNANSDLRYPKKFRGQTREVYLTGEAYFQVAQNVEKPFIVHSGKLKTQVLGTSFTVNAYGNDQPADVSVLTGKVKVQDQQSKRSVVLNPGETAANDKDGFRLSRFANPEDVICWIDGKMIFEDLSLRDCALKLSNKFGVRIKIAIPGASIPRITAIFQDKTLPVILNAVTKQSHTRYKLWNNTYIIY